MALSSHSRAALSSPEGVSFVTFPGLLGGAFGAGVRPDFAHGGAADSGPSKCDNRHKLYFPGLLESASSVMYLTL